RRCPPGAVRRAVGRCVDGPRGSGRRAAAHAAGDRNTVRSREGDAEGLPRDSSRTAAGRTRFWFERAWRSRREAGRHVDRAAGAGRAEPDYAAFYGSARKVAESLGLDFLDVTRRDLSILSSAHWPARFGYRNEWASCSPCYAPDSFLARIPLPDGASEVALA